MDAFQEAMCKSHCRRDVGALGIWGFAVKELRLSYNNMDI